MISITNYTKPINFRKLKLLKINLNKEIFSILKQVKLENDWLKDNRTIQGFTFLLVSISKSDESVKSLVLTLKISASQNEKCSDDVNVVEHTIASFVCDSA